MDIKPFKNKIWLASPTMHGDELRYMTEAYETNWMSTVGENINVIERDIAHKLDVPCAVALSSGTAALHLAVRLAAEEVYGSDAARGHGSLAGHKVFCSDMTFCASVNPVVYEGGEPVFIDSEYETWNMDPVALERAFEMYPDVKIVVLAHLYGTPAKLDEILDVCSRYDAILVEDAAESLGATYDGRETGGFGRYGAISFNGNKIITGSSGGMLLGHAGAAEKARKWSTQAREAAAWYQHEEIGYNYRMSNVIAGVVRGQIPHLDEHIAQKKRIYERYKAGLADLPVHMNPFDADKSSPNYWLSCMLIEPDAMCKQVRSDSEALYHSEPGRSCPTEILETLAAYNAEGRPIWKPLHLQPVYRSHAFVTRHGTGRGLTDAYIKASRTAAAPTSAPRTGTGTPAVAHTSAPRSDSSAPAAAHTSAPRSDSSAPAAHTSAPRSDSSATSAAHTSAPRTGTGTPAVAHTSAQDSPAATAPVGALDCDTAPFDIGADIFARGLCLPSDNKMTETDQDIIIEIIRSCFK